MYGYRNVETKSKRRNNGSRDTTLTFFLYLGDFLSKLSGENYSPEIGLVGSRVIISIAFSAHARS